MSTEGELRIRMDMQLAKLAVQKDAYERRWWALHAATVEYLAPIFQTIVEKRKSRTGGHGGGGRSARRRGEARKRRTAYLAAALIRACNAAHEARHEG